MMAATNMAAQEVRAFEWQDVNGKHSGQNDYLPKRPKEDDLRTQKITAVEAGDTVTLTCDVPALYVTLNHGSADIYSDNGFTWLPDIEKVITITRKRGTAGAAPPSMVTSIKYLNAS